MFYHVTNARVVMIAVNNIPSSPTLYLFKLNYVFFGVWVPYRTGIFKYRPNNLSLVYLYLTLYISFLLFGHFFDTQMCVTKKKCPNYKKEIYHDKYRHIRERLVGLYLNMPVLYGTHTPKKT
jgi:hypothetical protein